MKMLPIPAWMFLHPGEHFMVAIQPDGRVDIDGGHSHPSGVAKAVRLREGIPLSGNQPERDS